MIISRQEIYQVLRTHAQRPEPVRPRPQAAGGPVRAEQGDQVDLSARAREVQRLREAIGRLPDVRRDKVERVARELAQGTYQVGEEEVAEKILGRSLVDRLV